LNTNVKEMFPGWTKLFFFVSVRNARCATTTK